MFNFLKALLLQVYIHTLNVINFNKPMIYVSGPMSNIPNKNHELFCDVSWKLRKLGYRVVNPAENDFGSTHRTWAWYMKLDLGNVVKCHAIAVLPDWEKSRGAVIEIAMAERLEIPIFNYESILEEGFKNPILPIVEVVAYLKKDIKHERKSTSRATK